MKAEVKDVAAVRKNLRPVSAVECDKGQVVGVLVKILTNASQAIKSQCREIPGTIRIDTYAEAGYTVCRVYNDGPGIQPEHLKRIFDPFFTTREAGGGMGLGLSMSYTIIRKSGGDLLVESEPGAGVTFLIKLPAAVCHKEAESKENIYKVRGTT